MKNATKKGKGSGASVAPTVALPWTAAEVLRDYRIAVESREASIIGRKQVLSGKAKFGIFGDGKELPQLAMAAVFQPGDWRSGYYRDQTFMFAIGASDVKKFFAQLYAHTDVAAEPASAGRSMNGHFATRFVDDEGNFGNLATSYNVSADVSPTGSQMPRLVGLAYASRLFREVDELRELTQFSSNGNEVAFGTIGNASCAEGMFWESVNAIGVLRSPAVISIWDDGYGISVPNDVQVTKSDVGTLLKGFQREPGSRDGFDIHVVRAWDYAALRKTYETAAHTARTEHVPQIVHVIEVTQPQGHSTSGSHERYKTPERLQWEKDYDGIARMRTWILADGIASEADLLEIESDAINTARKGQQDAFREYMQPILDDRSEASAMMAQLADACEHQGMPEAGATIRATNTELLAIREPFRRDVMVATHQALVVTAQAPAALRRPLLEWRRAYNARIAPLYSSHLYAENGNSPLNVSMVQPEFATDALSVNGSEVINAFFKQSFAADPRLVVFGEDAGKLGDVNQGLIGCQTEFGELRVSDTGIRECTILGQAIGMAMRGLRPIAEIQYLDYVLYALQLMSDDLATVQWRTRGGQKAPVIVRTRGHRLEGIWHSGSPMAGIINLVRGMHVCVPRNFVQAAGMYATLLKGDDPALVVEVLNGYRLKETLPTNIGSYTVELGVPEVVRTGTDITLVTYGASVRVALEAAVTLEKLGISLEVVDVQTLLPFDRYGIIGTSLRKTNRLVVMDEDVPGGTTAYIMQQVLELQQGYRFLDSAPVTITANEHRPAYGTDGGFWSKPEAEHIVDACYGVMREVKPGTFPELV